MTRKRWKDIEAELLALGDPGVAAHSQRFFKTGVGEYGEGDKFIGVRMPVIRQAVKTFGDTSIAEARKLLHSPYHEVRLFALILLTRRFARGESAEREKIYQLYLRETRYINNWDLVDCSAHLIVGPWLLTRSRAPLYTLVQSKVLWERRIAVMATFHFIKHGQFDDTLRIAEALLKDREDLIHKAVGWMLREVGKRDLATQEAFMARHYQAMPRTMLRYAIEKFVEPRRQAYLKGEV